VDPLLLEALRFGLAILAGGLVAVITQRLAFRDARRLERGQDTLAKRALAANVRAELVEDQRIAKESRSALLHRSAWDAARGLPWPDEVLRHLLDAYVAIDALNAARVALTQPPRPGTTVAIGGRWGEPDLNPMILATEVAIHDLERILAEGWPEGSTPSA
jgi:hypothetical protein